MKKSKVLSHLGWRKIRIKTTPKQAILKLLKGPKKRNKKRKNTKKLDVWQLMEQKNIGATKEVLDICVGNRDGDSMVQTFQYFKNMQKKVVNELDVLKDLTDDLNIENKDKIAKKMFKMIKSTDRKRIFNYDGRLMDLFKENPYLIAEKDWLGLTALH